MNRPSQVYKDLAFCENPLEREQEVEDVKVEKVQSLQEVRTEHSALRRSPEKIFITIRANHNITPFCS